MLLFVVKSAYLQNILSDHVSFACTFVSLKTLQRER